MMDTFGGSEKQSGSKITVNSNVEDGREELVHSF